MSSGVGANTKILFQRLENVDQKIVKRKINIKRRSVRLKSLKFKELKIWKILCNNAETCLTEDVPSAKRRSRAGQKVWNVNAV